MNVMRSRTVALAVASLWVAVGVTGAAPPAAEIAVAAPAPPLRSFEVAVEARSTGAAQLSASDLSATLNGNPIQVVDARPIAPGEWDVLVYVDGLAAKGDEIGRAAAALEAAIAELTSLGRVTVLVADTLVEPWVEDTRDVDDLRSAFAELDEATFEQPASPPADFLATRRGLLLDQVGRRPWGKGARLLITVGDPNGERSAAGSGGRGGAAKGDPNGSDAPARRGELATAVASLGWVALPLYLSGGGVAVSPLADATGGDAISDAAALAPALARLAERRLLRVEAPVASIAPLSVSAPAGWTVRAPRFLATATPDFVLRARVDALFGEEDAGELEVAASAALDSDGAGEPELAVEVLADAPSTGGGARRFTGKSSRLRTTFVLARQEEEPLLIHYQGTGASLDGAGAWLLQARLDAPKELDSLAVVVEDTVTGEWGGAVAEVEGEGIEVSGSGRVATEVADLRGKRSTAAMAATTATATEGPLVRLVPPRERELSGVQTFRAMALNAFIERVAFLLDGKQVAEDRGDPFVAHIDLGREPSQHEVKAIAYDRAGRELCHDAVTVNRPRTAFGVHIVELRGAAAAAGVGTLARGPAAAATAGPIEVAADVAVPPRQRVERVEFYWNETLVATLDAPPWKATLGAQPSTGADYVRVVAQLDDGQSLEDVQVVGASGTVEKVEVNLVEIFTVVLDQEGTPVRDLKQEEVSVRRAGKPVELERFGLAEDLPLDVGLVIDTSQSMEVLMDDTRQAAVRFIGDLIRPGDRAFLVDFDSKPRLAQPMTRNMMDLVKAMTSLRASGNTALFDSVVFTVLGFEEGEDRRAIVLLTDGEDYKSRFSDRQAALQARSAGVPVYFVSLAGMDAWRPATKQDDLEYIAKQTGGHVFYVSQMPELDTAYARIGAELRSQYVLAFSTPKPLTDDELSKLEVRVSRPGSTVRAVVAGRSVQTR